MAIIHINRDNFESEVLQAKNRVLIDFWAAWCGPCQMLAPVLDELAAEHEDITIAKINVDENPEITREFGVHNIPTLVLMENGNPTQKIVGYRPKEDIEKYL